MSTDDCSSWFPHQVRFPHVHSSLDLFFQVPCSMIVSLIQSISQGGLPTRKFLANWFSIWYWTLGSPDDSSAQLFSLRWLITFFIFCMKIGFNEQIKVTNPIQKHTYYAQNLVYGSFWGPESTFNNLTQILFIRFFFVIEPDHRY